MKLYNMLIAILFALIIAPMLAMARVFAPQGVDALNTQGTHEGGLSRTAEGALIAHGLVSFGTAPASQVIPCTASTRPIGTCYDEAATAKPVTVLPLLGGPTRLMVASKAIAAGVRVYATAGQKVTDAVVAGAYLVGESLTAAAGDGSVFEVMPLSPVVNPA
jgi:hypothetical protein